jgi:hypothetical protein
MFWDVDFFVFMAPLALLSVLISLFPHVAFAAGFSFFLFFCVESLFSLVAELIVCFYSLRLSYEKCLFVCSYCLVWDRPFGVSLIWRHAERSFFSIVSVNEWRYTHYYSWSNLTGVDLRDNLPSLNICVAEQLLPRLHTLSSEQGLVWPRQAVNGIADVASLEFPF